MQAKLISGRKKEPRRREFLFCPDCGSDLERQRPRRIGDLFADPRGDTIWKGREVILTVAERIILHSLLTASDRQSRRDVDRGHFISALTIAERSDGAIGSLTVQLASIRRAFRQVDPGFNMIENRSGAGYRWRVGRKVPRVMARSRRHQRYVLHDDGALVVNKGVRVFFDPVKATRIIGLLQALILADGEYVASAKLLALGGPGGPNALWDAMRRIRDRLRAAGLDAACLQSNKKYGYKLVV